MTIPSTSDLYMYDGDLITQTPWDGNLTQIVAFLASGNFDVSFGSVTANTFTGLPTETVSIVTGEDISAGDVIRVSGGLAVKATNASDVGITAVIGIATGTVVSGGTLNVTANYYASFAGLTVGSTYYVGIDGEITTTAPAFRTVEIGKAASATRLNVEIVSRTNTHPLTYVPYWDRKDYQVDSDAVTIPSTYGTVYNQENIVSTPWTNNIGIQNKVSLHLTFTGSASSPSTLQAKISYYDGGWIDAWESNTFAIYNPGAYDYNTVSFDLHTGNSTNWDIYTLPVMGINAATKSWRLQLLGSGTTPELNNFAFQWDK
tara:strand:+ start:42 stop:992 length:951 start_codon:yes stop_codon:yes gene_type:complete